MTGLTEYKCDLFASKYWKDDKGYPNRHCYDYLKKRLPNIKNVQQLQLSRFEKQCLAIVAMFEADPTRFVMSVDELDIEVLKSIIRAADEVVRTMSTELMWGGFEYGAA